jgi:hypothetical protein
MKTRTWPYGTTREGTVMRVLKSGSGRNYPVYVIADDHSEGHVVFGQNIEPEPEVGTRGTLTFVQGGPTGGYWKFEPNQKTK